MSRAQYLKTLERDVDAAAKIINELTRENYELKQLLRATAKNRTQNETKPTRPAG